MQYQHTSSMLGSSLSKEILYDVVLADCAERGLRRRTIPQNPHLTTVSLRCPNNTAGSCVVKILLLCHSVDERMTRNGLHQRLTVLVCDRSKFCSASLSLHEERSFKVKEIHFGVPPKWDTTRRCITMHQGSDCFCVAQHSRQSCTRLSILLLITEGIGQRLTARAAIRSPRSCACSASGLLPDKYKYE